jgi:hypothetical protein
MTRAHVNHRADAQREFMSVIAEYEAGNQRVRELAAQAYANIGLVNLTVLPEDTLAERIDRYRAAAKAYEAAIAISQRSEWQAYYYVSLAFIHLGLQECDAAAKAWANADVSHNKATRPNPSYEPWRSYVEQQWPTSSCTLPG